MKLTIHETARVLAVSEQTILRWVREEGLASSRINEQLRFNRADVLEWATTRGLAVATDIFPEAEDEGESGASFAAALERGGVHYNVGGAEADVDAVLRAVVKVMHLPEDADREVIYEVMRAREALGSTGIGHGIAIPHVRRPIVQSGFEASIALCFLAAPVDFGAGDREPVTTVFSFVTPTTRVHLKLLARLAAALHDSTFLRVLGERAPPENILAEARRAEREVAASRPNAHGGNA